MSSNPNGPPVAYAYITKTKGSKLALRKPARAFPPFAVTASRSPRPSRGGGPSLFFFDSSEIIVNLGPLPRVSCSGRLFTLRNQGLKRADAPQFGFVERCSARIAARKFTVCRPWFQQ